MQTCSVCFEEDLNLINPIYCSCKIFLHKQCFKKCLNFNIKCPICRTKNIIQNNIINNIINNQLNNNFILNFANKIFKIFANHPNIFTFLLYFITSIIISIFYILPKSIKILIKDRYFSR